MHTEIRLTGWLPDFEKRGCCRGLESYTSIFRDGPPHTRSPEDTRVRRRISDSQIDRQITILSLLSLNLDRYPTPTGFSSPRAAIRDHPPRISGRLQFVPS
jgi:hypothetical protein